MTTVLIAEDDRILRARLVQRLETHADRFDVIAVANGKEAMDVLEKHPVSLLVTDIKMPKVDGLELLAYVNRHHPTVFSFVITGHGTPELQKKLPAEVVRFFEKPIDMDRLAEAILQVLDRDIPSGTVNGISVVRFLQMIHMEQKTCLVEVSRADGGTGSLFFGNGELYDAALGDLIGEDAALAIITEQPAEIRFRYFPENRPQKRIKTDLDALIDKALGREAKVSDDQWDDIISDVLD